MRANVSVAFAGAADGVGDAGRDGVGFDVVVAVAGSAGVGVGVRGASNGTVDAGDGVELTVEELLVAQPASATVADPASARPATEAVKRREDTPLALRGVLQIEPTHLLGRQRNRQPFK